ncbi:phophatase 2c family protein [Moniliophthora roreri MCA 2997]|uniref:Phophatase 2c family protein n=1 Tax=Moniliophthora roreri (strain MCA 2997) TaxID=1381753 RepID=V2WP19_MONRO|nr:phophatase 2c family protein [Moniliophthora roreri MCA 2997]
MSHDPRPERSDGLVKETDMGMAGKGPWKYTLLSEPQLSAEASRIAIAHTKGLLHSVTFQPQQTPSNSIGNQDRCVAEDWEISGAIWKFRAIFDGHANGNETVDYAYQVLPSKLKDRLCATLNNEPSPSPESISTLLSSTITDFDNSIETDLRTLFPSPEHLEGLTDEEIQKLVNDGGPNYTKVARCMRGTTVVIALLSPNSEDIWVATLGDSQAVLGTKNTSGEWISRILSFNHNGNQASEVEILKEQHPGEDKVVTEGRVLGVIAVTRAIGDHLFKLPSIYTSRVFRNAYHGLRPGSEAMVEKLLERNITPPYLSNVPDITHLTLKKDEISKACLILCSDGLMDLYDENPQEDDSLKTLDLDAAAKQWVQIVGEESALIVNEKVAGDVNANLALRLVYKGLGGGRDVERLSRFLTVQMDEKWMDDTTVIVEGLGL